MASAEKGTTVTVNYTGKLPDGRVFDTTIGHQPIDFVVGDGRVLKGFEKSVIGMSPGDSKTVQLPPEDCYGPKRDELIVSVAREEIPSDMQLEVGQQVNVTSADRQQFPARIMHVDDSKVVLDANHPLAGETLTFEISVLEVV
jgi:peptidylprolyl isomerase